MRTFVFVMFIAHVFGGLISLWTTRYSMVKKDIPAIWYNIFMACAYLATAAWAAYLLWFTK